MRRRLLPSSLLVKAVTTDKFDKYLGFICVHFMPLLLSKLIIPINLWRRDSDHWSKNTSYIIMIVFVFRLYKQEVQRCSWGERQQIPTLIPWHLYRGHPGLFMQLNGNCSDRDDLIMEDLWHVESSPLNSCGACWRSSPSNCFSCCFLFPYT